MYFKTMVATDPFYHQHVAAAHDAAVPDPFWGPSTSSVDWCESNYAHSRHIAELFNTLSSLPLLLVCVYGAQGVRRPSGALGRIPRAHTAVLKRSRPAPMIHRCRKRRTARAHAPTLLDICTLEVPINPPREP